MAQIPEAGAEVVLVELLAELEVYESCQRRFELLALQSMRLKQNPRSG
jgi:hypothetical protein